MGWEYYSKFLEDAKEDPELLVLGFEPNLWTWRRAIETAKSELHVGLPCGGNQGCVFIFPFLVGDFGGRAQLLRSGSFAGCNTILQIRAFDAATLRPHALRRCRSLLEQGVRIPADHFKNATQNGDHAGLRSCLQSCPRRRQSFQDFPSCSPSSVVSSQRVLAVLAFLASPHDRYAHMLRARAVCFVVSTAGF